MATDVLRRADPSVLFGVHMHNDLGFGLASTFETLRAGIRYVASSWLGLGERSGLTATEQLLVALASDPAALEERFGIESESWTDVALSDLIPLATDIARWLRVPLRVTDPVVGSGVNSLSTGTPFQDPARFVPYDAERLLGVSPSIVVTQLASRKVLQEVAAREGLSASAAVIAEATRLVKNRCYARNEAVVDQETTRQLLARAQSRATQPPRDVYVSASTLDFSMALPLTIMRVAAARLPASIAIFDGGELLLSPEAAAACRRVTATDFTKTAWELDNPEDREAIVMWTALGGSFFADFGDDPTSVRIFAWLLSPCVEAAQYTLTTLKGRDGFQIPTSIVTAPERFQAWLDRDRAHITLPQLTHLLSLGPVGVRAAVRPGTLPRYFVEEHPEGPVGQAVFPGLSDHWKALLSLLEERSDYEFLGATSANFSRHGGHEEAGRAHYDLSELQSQMAHLGVPILSGSVTCGGDSLVGPNRQARYRRLNEQHRALSSTASISPIPSSLSILSPEACPQRWKIVRHGSLHVEALRHHLAKIAVSIEPGAPERLPPRNYIGREADETGLSVLPAPIFGKGWTHVT
jgi:hypothetical protein